MVRKSTFLNCVIIVCLNIFIISQHLKSATRPVLFFSERSYFTSNYTIAKPSSLGSQNVTQYAYSMYSIVFICNLVSVFSIIAIFIYGIAIVVNLNGVFCVKTRRCCAYIFPVVKTFRLTFLRMRNKCKIIYVQRNNKAFSI